MKSSGSNISTKFLKTVMDTIRQYDMLRPGDRVLAAVSGGADSVCLLRSLLELRRRLDIEVMVANMDHGIRGAESVSDSEFVKQMTVSLDLKFIHKKIDLPSLVDGTKSMEEAAREERYNFLNSAALDNRCNVIATGHTIDDQAETVLMRVISGTSIDGISGIPPVREGEGLRVIRPLISVAKSDIKLFLESEECAWVEDSTNKNKDIFRNRVREEVIPYLEGFNPRIKRAMVNLSDTVREDLEFLRFERKKALERCKGSGNNEVRIKLRDIILQPVALRKEIFKELFKNAGGTLKKLSYRHWKDMDLFIRTADKSSSLDFPGDIRVTRKSDELVFKKR